MGGGGGYAVKFPKQLASISADSIKINERARFLDEHPLHCDAQPPKLPIGSP